MSGCAWCGKVPATSLVVVREGRTTPPDPNKRMARPTAIRMRKTMPACADCAKTIKPSTFEGRPPKEIPGQLTIYDDEGNDE